VFVFWGEGGMDSVFLTDSNFLVPWYRIWAQLGE
jgi:hypothetical protein